MGIPLVSLLHLIDTFIPRSRYIFFNKKRFEIADAHFAHAYINLYQYFQDNTYLKEAKKILEYLIKNSTKTKNGMGWGYPYDWRNGYGVFKKDAPLITVTPYCFDAIWEMYKITESKKYLNILEKIAYFAAYDLNETKLSSKSTASSYGINDNSKVINAIGYRAVLLLQAGKIFKKNEYRQKAKRNISFILNSQNNDGSWYYAPDSRFIDNFHTCFVLKKLTKAYEILNDHRILKKIKKGYNFYINNLIRSDNTPKHFYKSRYPKLRKIEMYDYAEGISLGIDLSEIIDGAYEFSELLAKKLINTYQLDKGYFITRITAFNTKIKIPYLRWPQAQLFYALTKMLIETK